MANAPRNLKECYLLRNNKIIPSKVLFLHDSFENLVNYYHKEKGFDLSQAELIAEDEIK